jgi:hypothetical protein
VCETLASGVPLVSGWPKSVKSAILHVISMAHYAVVAVRGWAANGINARACLNARNERLGNQPDRAVQGCQ